MPRDEAPDVRRLRARADATSLDAIHQLLHGLWHDHPGVDDEDRMLFDTAVGEIAANIVEHGRNGLELTLDLCATQEVVQADFRDDGDEVTIDLVALTMPDVDAERGRGIALARAALDELRYERADGQNHWLLRRRCRRVREQEHGPPEAARGTGDPAPP